MYGIFEELEMSQLSCQLNKAGKGWSEDTFEYLQW